MITEVSYERVFNLGNFENHRIGATATVENGDHLALAFAECRSAVEQQHALFLAEREAEQVRQHDEWEARRQAQLAAIRQRDEDEEDLPL